jgi:hypothetical protein
MAVMPADVAISPIRVVDSEAANALAREDALTTAQRSAQAALAAPPRSTATDKAVAVAETEVDVEEEENASKGDEYWLEMHTEATAQRAKQLALCDEYEHALIKLAITDKARRDVLRADAIAREQAAADEHRAAVEALLAAEEARKVKFLAEWRAAEAAHSAEVELQKAALVERVLVASKASEESSKKVAEASAKLHLLLRF